MAQLNRAHGVLSDERLRRIYNDYLTSELQVTWDTFLALAKQGAMMVHFGVRPAKPTLASDSFANEPSQSQQQADDSSSRAPPSTKFVRPPPPSSSTSTSSILMDDDSVSAYKRQYSEPYQPTATLDNEKINQFRNGEL
jgi:hypothetical protein